EGGGRGGHPALLEAVLPHPQVVQPALLRRLSEIPEVLGMQIGDVRDAEAGVRRGARSATIRWRHEPIVSGTTDIHQVSARPDASPSADAHRSGRWSPKPARNRLPRTARPTR